MVEDRRKHKRFNISFPVECKILPTRNYFYTVTKDLSLGGLKILNNDFISKGNLLSLDLNIIDKVLKLKAKVAWCNRERASDRHLVGLEFVEVNKYDHQSLSHFLEDIRFNQA